MCVCVYTAVCSINDSCLAVFFHCVSFVNEIVSMNEVHEGVNVWFFIDFAMEIYDFLKRNAFKARTSRYGVPELLKCDKVVSEIS